MSWKIGEKPEPFAVSCPEAEYAVLMMMGADGSLSKALMPDIREMMKGVAADMTVLLWIDTPEEVGVIGEVSPGQYHVLETLPEVNTGDPRPLADFLARALVSFSAKTKIAVGFWGHGKGVFGDYDPMEMLVKQEHRFGPLGVPLPKDAGTVDVVEPMKQRLQRSLLPDATSENSLTNREAGSALTVAFSRAGRTEPVEMLFFDTCLSGSVEMFAELRRYAKTYVASALLIPGGGWNYFYWLKATDKERPKTAEDWAFLAAGTFGAQYDPRVSKEKAQLWAFRTDHDIFGEFGRLVEALKSLDEDGLRLVGRAAARTQRIHYGENLDFGQLLEGIEALAEVPEVKALTASCIASYEKAIVGASIPPPGGERFTGLTIWCPVDGDAEGVGRYYRSLEFDRLCGWMSLMTVGADRLPPEDRGYAVFSFWGLGLLKARAVERTLPEGDRLLLAVPEACRKYAGELVDGEYRFHGGAGVIRFASYVALREFVRRLLELREGDEFEALRGCLEPGWVIAGSVAGAMVAELDRYEGPFKAGSTLPQEATLFDQMRSAFKKVAADGVLIFL